MSKRSKTILIVVAAAIIAYLAYRWWSNRHSSTGVNTTGTGSNLNSVAPSLAGGSQGPDSGLNYYPGNSQIDITLPSGTGEEPEPKPKPKPPPHKIHGRPIFAPKGHPRYKPPPTKKDT